jgi:hypothetical protein
MSLRRDGKRASVWRWFSLKKLGFFTIIYTVALLPGIGCSMTGRNDKGTLWAGPRSTNYPQAEIVSQPRKARRMAGERYDAKFRSS